MEQQDETINVIQAQAAGVEKDTEAGYVLLDWSPGSFLTITPQAAIY